MENYDSEYTSEEYIDGDEIYADNEASAEIADIVAENIAQSQPVIVQPQVISQPVYTQPVYTQPVIAQPIYTQPIIVQPAEPPAEAVYPAEPTYPIYPVQGMISPDEIKADRWNASPILVFFALLLCFPIGLILLLFFTRWGAFPKIFLTLFTLICIWFAYEIFAFYTAFDLPSLLNNIL